MIKVKNIIPFIVLFALFPVILGASNVLLGLIVIVYFGIIIFLFTKVKDNIVPICFMISLFVFLIGREVLFEYFGLRRYYIFSNSINNHSYISILLALIGLSIGFLISKTNNASLFKNKTKDLEKTRAISKRIYYILLIPSLASVVYTIVFVRSVGYTDFYEAGNSAVPSIISIFANMESMPFYIYISTKPSKKESKYVLMSYLLYNTLTILTGKRFQAVSFILVFVIYFIIRHKKEEIWIKKWYVYVAVALLPFALIFLGCYDDIRAGNSVEFEGIENGIMGFFEEIGGSINVIKREKFFENKLDNGKIYSFAGIHSLLFENKIVAFLFQKEVYLGNSVDHALYGNSLMHTLSYYTYREQYLSGHGVGSCYIAELYHDFGYFGVICGNIFYGWMLKKINNVNFRKPYSQAILFLMLHGLLLAPRGGFDTFINEAFGIKVIFVFLLILAIDKNVKIVFGGNKYENRYSVNA